ncbi:MAG: nicotinate-nucleotide--dimethylbenzimidazole phosphoribosyltransferase [Candidatus Omnitrophica bacterium]|nr:nicotinate-nucleotide--dimethylbenzimidazole phosphoribosyltransferase [Candidatus Omnitrophota bacterium]
MRLLNDTLEKIKEPDYSLIKAVQRKLDNLTKPKGSLGRLEEIAKQIVVITGNLKPKLKNKVIFVMAGDHGVAEEGVSAYPKEVTYQMVYNFIKGGAAINVLANFVGARIVLVDMGIAVDLKTHPKLIIKKIGYGTKNIAKEPAMSKKEAIASIEAGIEVFESEYNKGMDIVGLGEMGIANTTASSAIASAITGESIEDIAGRGTGVDDKGLSKKIEVIKKALKVNNPLAGDGLDVLAKVGGFEIGGLVGVILSASAKKIPIVIDGFITTAAALIAYTIKPQVKEFMIASHCSKEKGHKLMLKYLGLIPLLDFDMRLGEGTGAALGISISEASIKILTEMATFSEAKVSKASIEKSTIDKN